MARKLNNWLLGYRDYTDESESPEMFHMWTGLSVLSAVTKRNTWVSQGYFQVYPNLYCILVSPPGTCRKSAAMGIGRDLLEKVTGISIEANKMTPQALINSLSGGALTAKKVASGKGSPNTTQVRIQQQSCTVLYSTEFSVMLGTDAHQNGMLSLLTDLYDCPNSWKYETLIRGSEILSNVFLGILGATTPDWLSSSIPKDAIGGGFTSRIIFVAQHRKRKDNPRPKITPAMAALEKDLIEDLNHIAGLSGEMILTPDADIYYDKWYRQQSAAPKEMDERFWGYLERKPVHLLKLAQLIARAASDANEVTLLDLEMALTILERTEPRMIEAFRGVGNATYRDISRVVEQLERNSGMLSWQELSGLNIQYLNTPELEIVLRTMTNAGMVREVTQLNSRAFFLNPKAPSPDAGDGIMNQTGGVTNGSGTKQLSAKTLILEGSELGEAERTIDGSDS